MIKRVLVFAMLVFFLANVAQAATPARIRAYINKLEAKLGVAKQRNNQARVNLLSRMIAEQNKRLQGMLAPAKVAAPLRVVKAAPGGPAVSGKIFFHYLKGLQNVSTANNFDVSRVYVTVKNKLGSNSSARVTFDVGRLDSKTLDTGKKSQQLFDYLKYAYADIKEPIPAELKILPMTFNARIGLQPTTWIGFVDKILGIRYISKSLNDINKVYSSADFGLGAFGKVNIPDMPVLKYHAVAVNGSGYKASESNKGKNIAVRLNSELYPGLVLALGGQVANLGQSTTMKVANILTSYNFEIGKTYLEYLYGTGISGYSIAANCEVLPQIKLLARIDNYDPNRSVANDQVDTVIAGVSYDVDKSVSVALDIQNATYGSAASSNAGKTLSTAYLHSQIKF